MSQGLLCHSHTKRMLLEETLYVGAAFTLGFRIQDYSYSA
jgi:hypothetical protein